MTGVNWERWARASGIGFVVLFIVAFITLGEPPKVNDSTDEIVSFFDGDRGRVLTSMIVFGIAFILLLWFVGAIANALREAGEGRLGATTIAMGATFVSLQAVIGAIAGGLALNTLTGSVDLIAAYPFAGLIAAATVGFTRLRLLPYWYGYVGLAAAVLVLLHGTNWATSGFWSASGGYLWITIIAGLGWTLITSVLLYTRAPATAAAPERAVPTT